MPQQKSSYHLGCCAGSCGEPTSAYRRQRGVNKIQRASKAFHLSAAVPHRPDGPAHRAAWEKDQGGVWGEGWPLSPWEGGGERANGFWDRKYSGLASCERTSRVDFPLLIALKFSTTPETMSRLSSKVSTQCAPSRRHRRCARQMDGKPVIHRMTDNVPVLTHWAPVSRNSIDTTTQGMT